MRLSWAARSDTGRRRASNEDSYLARPDLGLFVVADGMGGHAGGDVASRLAVEAIAEAVASSQGRPAHTRLRDAFEEANRRIASRATSGDELHGMATTAVAILSADRTILRAHVGDSRAYRLRGGELTRLTEDHSWVEEQVRAGVLSEQAAREHPWRNVVTRAIAGSAVFEPEIAEVPVETGDRLLLCSDGLISVVPEDRIGRLAGASKDLDRVCHDLVDAANAAGGPDNVTVVVVEIESIAPDEPAIR